MWALLANAVALLHAAWALFLVFGFIFALRKSQLAFLHLGGLLFSFFLNLLGWYCPLTHLENYLHSLHQKGTGYSSPFMMEYVYYLLYPDLPEYLIRVGEILFVCINLLGYAYLAKRDGLFFLTKRLGSRRRV